MCLSGTYKDIVGPGPCLPCPTDSVSDPGSTHASNCQCRQGYTGIAAAGTPAPCSDSTGVIPNQWGVEIFCSNFANPASWDDSCSSWQICELCGCSCAGSLYCPAPVALTACSACNSGKYKSDVGSAACSACPANSLSAAGSILNTTCTCNPGYTGADMLSCSACPPGTSKAASGDSACAAYVCPADQFSSQVAANTAEVCLACPTSSVSVPASTASTQCQCRAGTYEETHVLNPPYASRSYSSFRAGEFNSLLNDLHFRQAWSSLLTIQGEWMQMDAGENMLILGIITQGRGDSLRWVKEFTVQYALSGNMGSAVSLPQNFVRTTSNRNQMIEDLFTTPVYARYIRIIVSQWEVHISMRAALIVKSCSSCLATSTSVQGSVAESNCECLAGTYRLSSAADQRAIALVPGRAQLSTLANRGLRDYAATAQFNSSAGPPGAKGAVTFDRAVSQYIDGGSHRFNIGTNGFTAVAVVRFTMTPTSEERIFDFGSADVDDFGSGATILNNILLWRSAATSQLNFGIWNGWNVGANGCTVTLPNVIQQNNWLTIVATYDNSHTSLKMTVGTSTNSVQCTARTNRQVTNTLIGKTFWTNAYISGSIAGLYVVDALITAAEIQTVISRINAGEDTLQACIPCPEGGCSRCSTGYTGPDEGTCTLCEVGKFKDVIGSASCSPCPANTEALAGSSLVSDCKCVAGFERVNNTCVQCAAGNYSSILPSGVRECAACGPNASSVAGSVTATDCKCNHGFTGVDGGRCSQCEAGKFKNVNGTAACQPCPANSTSLAGSISPGACACTPGHHGIDCAQCPAGTFKAAGGPQACSVCVSNAYSPPGSISPDACACMPGHHGVDCAQCMPGHHGVDCAQCPAGTFKVAGGPQACSVCVPNAYSPPGSTSAAACNCMEDFFGSASLSCSVSQPQGAMPPNLTDLKRTEIVTAENKDIVAGSLKLTPSGHLEMHMTFALRMSTAVRYDILILTQFRSPPSSALHRKDGFLIQGHANDTYYNFPDLQSVEGRFLPGGVWVKDNFPGWRLGVTYRVAIVLFDANNVFLMQDVSELAHPMVKASSPLHVSSCPFDISPLGCSQLLHVEKTLRVIWQFPISRGYALTYIPPNAYQFAYFRVEVYSGADLLCLLGNVTCNAGEQNSVCYFDERIARVSIEAVLDDYHVVVLGGTIIGDGNYSATVVATSAHVRHGVPCATCIPCAACPANSLSAANSSLVSDCKCVAGFERVNNTCVQCAAGTYSSILPSGFRECATCGPNAGGVAGSVAVTDCRCNAGYTGVDGGSCSMCPAGKYKPVTTPGAPSWFVTAVGNFSTVKQACIDGGGELATITSLADNNIAVELCPDTVCYIGLVRDSGGNTPWYWLSGDPVVYSNLISTQDLETNQTSSATQDLETNETRCAIIKSNGTWEEHETGWSSFAGVCRIMCRHCPSNSLSLEASITLSGCQCNAGYTGADGGPCVACAAGSFKPLTGAASCTECPADSNSSTSGSVLSSACKCAPGFAGADGEACTQCPTGTYRAANFATNWARACGPSKNETCVATQVDTFDAGISSLAVDGNMDTNNTDNAVCTATGNVQNETWWSVDLERENFITTLHIRGRSDGSPSRTANYSIYIGNNNSLSGRFTQNTVCVSDQPQLPSTGAAATIICNQPISGRYVYFMLPRAEFLTLCEVEVWSSACSLCPYNLVSLPGSVAVGACQCDAGSTRPDGGACSECAPGTFHASPRATNCSLCPANSNSATGSALAAACTCNAGFSGPDGGPCTACPANSNSVAGSTLVCTCNAGFSGPDGGPCTACAAGTVKAASGSAPCAAYVCPANKFSSETTGDVVELCWACPASTLSLPESTSHAACQCMADTYEETHVLNPPHAARRYATISDNLGFQSLFGDQHGFRAWTNTTVPGTWMEIDAGARMKIVGIITQGDVGNEFVNTMLVQYRISTVWQSINDIFFNQNNSRKENLFASPVYARSIRIYALGWSVAMSMRAALVVKSCSSCLATSPSVQGSVSEAACECLAGTYRLSSAADERALALVPGRAQLSTLANRGLLNYTATAQFSNTAGPPGAKGAVTFDAPASQYMDGASNQFNIGTNGFTAVAVVRFQSQWNKTGLNQYLFDFNNGARNDNILFGRHLDSSQFVFIIRNGADNNNCAVVTSSSMFKQNTWMTVVATYDYRDMTIRIRVGNDVVASKVCTARIDRTILHTFVGKSSSQDVFAQDVFSMMQIAGLYAVDALLTVGEIEAIISRINKGEDTLQACQACPVNTYKAGAGNALSACQACPVNSTSPTGSATNTTCRCNAGYSGPAGGPCTACPKGTSKAAPGGSA